MKHVIAAGTIVAFVATAALACGGGSGGGGGDSGSGEGGSSGGGAGNGGGSSADGGGARDYSRVAPVPRPYVPHTVEIMTQFADQS